MEKIKGKGNANKLNQNRFQVRDDGEVMRNEFEYKKKGRQKNAWKWRKEQFKILQFNAMRWAREYLSFFLLFFSQQIFL